MPGTKREKTCQYRHCGVIFQDTSRKSTMKFCQEEHRRREKLFRAGVASDESYFRVKAPVGIRTCQTCGLKFERLTGKSVRCDSCRQTSRHKACRKCGAAYVDETLKNTRRFCDACQNVAVVSRGSISEHTEIVRERRVFTQEGGRLDDITTLEPYTTTWWGRVGELLFLHLYPDAIDAIRVYGNKCPFDAQHPDLGRVSVKTAQVRLTRKGKEAWSFQVFGVRENSDTAFLLGLSKDRSEVLRVWVVPSNQLPRTIRVMSPGSSEYGGRAWESLPDVPFLNRKLRSILESHPKRVTPTPVRPQYERMVLGRLGEAVYQVFHAMSEHVAANDPLAPFDFRDPDGRTVNVRLRRRAQRNRWTFFRSRNPVDDYFFVGLDPEGKRLEVIYRVPSESMPPRGFSVRHGGSSKWDRYQVSPCELPCGLFELVGATDVEEAAIRISSATKDTVREMTPEGKSELLSVALRYHRFYGFPYPAVPSDKRLVAEVQGVLRYTPNGQDLPPDNSGLAVCSAYMPHRFDTRNADADFSALGAFLDDARLLRALRFSLEGEQPDLSRRALRSALTALNRTPTSFRPAVTRALVDRYCRDGGTVLDPCAGWGGRLMGTLVSGRQYVGVEPDSRTVRALFQLGSRLLEHLDLDYSKVCLHEGTIQNAPLSLCSADFVITSPPYWTKELYGSSSASLSLTEWYTDFLVPLFQRTYSLTTENARFAVNVSDGKVHGKHVPLESLTLRAAEETGYRLETTWRLQKGRFGKQSTGRSEPIFIFAKPQP